MDLMFQYAHFNWEKERANQQDWFAQASRKDQYGNKTGYNRALNEWDTTLSPTQQQISDAQQKEQLLQLTKDAPAARKVKEAIQARAYDAREPFHKAATGYQFDLPPSQDALQSQLSRLMASNDMQKTKSDQSMIMRQAARLGRGGDASRIIQSADQNLGNANTSNNRMLQARNEALKEYAGRQQLHEAQWGEPMKMWGALMSQGGDMPNIPKNAMPDVSGQMQQQLLSAFNQGTSRVGSAFDSLAAAAGKSPDLSAVAKALASVGKGTKNSKGQDDQTTYGGVTQVNKDASDDGSYRSDFGILDNQPTDL